MYSSYPASNLIDGTTNYVCDEPGTLVPSNHRLLFALVSLLVIAMFKGLVTALALDSCDIVYSPPSTPTSAQFATWIYFPLRPEARRI